MTAIFSPTDDEIDLREIALTLLRRWKLLVIMTLLAGITAGVISFLQKPVYEASSKILVDQSVYSSSTSPTILLLTDAIRQKVAEKMGVAADSLSDVSIAADSPSDVGITA